MIPSFPGRRYLGGHGSVSDWLAYGCLALLLIFTAVTVENRLTDKPAKYDGEANVKYAYNLVKYGVYSHHDADDPDEIEPTMVREPFYPFVLALWMKMAIDLPATSVECLLASDDQCETARRIIKWPQLFFLVALTAVTFLAGSGISGSHLVGLASACFVGLNPHYLLFANRFYTEIPAALLLLIHCYALALLARGYSTKLCLAAGVSLGLLILTKAVFFYWLFLLAPLLLFLAARGRVHWGSMVLVLAAASLLPGLWIARNSVSLDEPHLAGRGGETLAIRAEYTTMPWPEYWTAYLHYTPILRDKAHGVWDEERFEALDRQNPDGYYRRVQNGYGLVKSAVDSNDETGMRDESLRILLENWPKQLALVPLFAYRGVWQIDDSRRFLIQTTLPAWGFLIGSILALRWRPERFFIFVLPVWFSIGFHATLTHFIQRYSLPLVPAMTICAFWTGWMILTRLMPTVGSSIERGDSPHRGTTI